MGVHHTTTPADHSTVRWPAFEMRCPAGHLVAGGLKANFQNPHQLHQPNVTRIIRDCVKAGVIKPWCPVCGAALSTWQFRSTTITKLEAADQVYHGQRLVHVLKAARLDFGSWRYLLRPALVAGTPDPNAAPPIEPPTWPAVEVLCQNNHQLNLVWKPGSNAGMDLLDAIAFHWAMGRPRGHDRCPVCGDRNSNWKLTALRLTAYEGLARIGLALIECTKLAGYGLTWMQLRMATERALPPGKLVQTSWAIYERPEDYPEFFVVRQWWVFEGNPEPVPSPGAVLLRTLHEARAVVPRGLFRMPPTPGHDVPALVETWI